MDISFKGIQNIGIGEFVLPNYKNYRMIAQLTDNVTKDYSEFKDILKKYPNPLNKTFLKFDIYQMNDNSGNLRLNFAVNDQTISVNDNSLHLFQKIAKLTNNIWQNLSLVNLNKVNDIYPTEKKYLKSLDCKKNFSMGESSCSESEIIENIKSIHDKNNVKKGVLIINNFIQAAAEDYFGKVN